MGRQRRKRAEKFARARQGRIPWSTDEYTAVLDERARLDRTPHDDWDRRERGLLLSIPESQEVVRILFNPDAVENQIATFVRERYQNQPHHVIMAHLMRYFAMNEFLRTNQPRLMEEGLIRSDAGGEEGRVEVADAILTELAISPYEQLTVDADGTEIWRYDRE